MKFLVDAQLPRSLSRLLCELGHDAIHTLELPNRNRTDDEAINAISMQGGRVVISKDSDFFDSFFRKQEPYKLLFLTVGNISNSELCDLFRNNILKIEVELEQSDVVEMNRIELIAIQ